jgi:hypothetical protein
MFILVAGIASDSDDGNDLGIVDRIETVLEANSGVGHCFSDRNVR